MSKQVAFSFGLRSRWSLHPSVIEMFGRSEFALQQNACTAQRRRRPEGRLGASQVKSQTTLEDLNCYPLPQNRLISCEIRRFFFTFCLQKFPEKLRDFAKFAVDPNRDPDRAKDAPWRSSSAPRLSCCLGLFFRFQIAAVRTFSMVLAASFWAAVVTWA